MSRLSALKPMKKNTNRTFKYAVCIDNSGFPVSLKVNKSYRVLPDKDAESNSDIRVVDESGEDYLYPSEMFELVDEHNLVEKLEKGAA